MLGMTVAAGSIIFVAMRIDLLADVNGNAYYFWKYTMKYTNGIRKCAAEYDVTVGCFDGCFTDRSARGTQLLVVVTECSMEEYQPQWCLLTTGAGSFSWWLA
jgi:hypothetical protein